ncbi:MAG: hypothetical protein ACI38Z_05140 [Parafannyhessea sp.]|uniref:hypothetical protein n=1 Tax=Parafannyhessea sp. TaxID=2847324 RepID=UPI003F06B349
METYKSLLYWGTTMGLSYLVSAALTEGNPRDDRVATIWLICLAIALAVYVAISTASAARRREAQGAAHDALVDSALKVLLRQKLVSEHDRLVSLGDADDTQRWAWMDLYETYEALCEATGDHNGVVDSYKQDVLDLPPWDGRRRDG